MSARSIRIICYRVCVLLFAAALVMAEPTDSLKPAALRKARKNRRHRKAAAAAAADVISPGVSSVSTVDVVAATRPIEALTKKIHFPAKYNPLLDQPNLSVKDPDSKDEVLIYGSRKAFTVTRMQYLKKEWCKTELLKQVIREEGCHRRTIINRFCYGQCNSFFIPKSDKKDLESGAFKSCAFCKPKRYSYITVTLNCPGKRPRYKRKRIQRIKQCKCMAQKLD